MSNGKQYPPNYGDPFANLPNKGTGTRIPPQFPKPSSSGPITPPAKPGIGWDYGKRSVYPLKPGGK